MAKTPIQRKQRRNERKTRRKTARLRASGKPLRFTAVSVGNLQAAEGQLPSFDMVAYSGGKLYIAGFEHPVVVDLSAAKVKGADGTIPITLDHEDTQRVGHSTSVQITPTQILMAGVVSAGTEWSQEVITAAKNGYRWQASIEGRVMGRDVVPEGQTVTVNGRTFEGPVIVARPFVLRATSFVSSGGDEDNVVRLAASNDTGDLKMDKQFKEWLTASGFDADLVASNQKQHDFLKAQYEAKGKKTEPETVKAAAKTEQPDHLAAMRESAAKELERQAAIQALCASEHKDIAAKAIREDWTAEKTELEVLRATRENSTPAIHVTDRSSVKSGEALEAKLLSSCGINPEKCGYDEKTLEASSKIKGGYGLQALMHDVIRASGGYYQPNVVDNDFIRETFRADNVLKASSSNLKANEGFSTISLTGVLSNVANKALLAAYQAVPGVRRTIAAQRQLRDFKAFTSYRVTGNGTLLPLGPDGEIKHAEVSEESYTNQLDTYARMMALTRKMMINDDLGAFMEIPRSFGRLSAITEEKVLFEVLLAAISAGTFFASGNANYLAGATYALSIDGLTAGNQKLLEQEDEEGNPILVTGKYLLVPPALSVYAGQLYKDASVNETTTANKPRLNSNPHVGLYEPVTSPFFGTTQGITGGSVTHWLLLADPMDVAVLEFAELAGQSGPIIESAETDFNTLGMQWRAYRDFGAAMQDPRGGVYANGTG